MQMLWILSVGAHTEHVACTCKVVRGKTHSICNAPLWLSARLDWLFSCVVRKSLYGQCQERCYKCQPPKRPNLHRTDFIPHMYVQCVTIYPSAIG